VYAVSGKDRDVLEDPQCGEEPLILSLPETDSGLFANILVCI